MLKLKRQNDQVVIMVDGETATLSLADTKSVNQTVDSLLEVVHKMQHELNDLQALRYDDAESYDTKGASALFRDTTSHFTAATRNNIEKAMSYSPAYLQTENLRNQVKALANAYKDCAESVLSSNGDTLAVGKSLYAKSSAILRDLDLLEPQLSAPLEKLKSIKMEKSMRQEILRKGIEQGKLQAKAGFSGMTNETLETAAALNKAKAVLGDKKSKRDKIISAAQKISK
jgi:hypothetical protein